MKTHQTKPSLQTMKDFELINLLSNHSFFKGQEMQCFSVSCKSMNPCLVGFCATLKISSPLQDITNMHKRAIKCNYNKVTTYKTIQKQTFKYPPLL